MGFRTVLENKVKATLTSVQQAIKISKCMGHFMKLYSNNYTNKHILLLFFQIDKNMMCMIIASNIKRKWLCCLEMQLYLIQS